MLVCRHGDISSEFLRPSFGRECSPFPVYLCVHGRLGHICFSFQLRFSTLFDNMSLMSTRRDYHRVCWLDLRGYLSNTQPSVHNVLTTFLQPNPPRASPLRLCVG